MHCGNEDVKYLHWHYKVVLVRWNCFDYHYFLLPSICFHFSAYHPFTSFSGLWSWYTSWYVQFLFFFPIKYLISKFTRNLISLILQACCGCASCDDLHVVSSWILAAAKIGEGILLDHGTGVVIGETAVVGNRVSLMQVMKLETICGSSFLCMNRVGLSSSNRLQT